MDLEARKSANFSRESENTSESMTSLKKQFFKVYAINFHSQTQEGAIWQLN